jgi:hypothetical protein
MRYILGSVKWKPTGKNRPTVRFFFYNKNIGTKKFRVSKECITKLKNILKEQRNIAGMMYKTPILTEEEALKLENEKNQQYEVIIREFREIIDPLLGHLDILINQEPEKPEDDLEYEAAKVQETTKGRPPPPAKPAKAGDKSAAVQQESKLKATLGGIESLILLIDERFIELPFETLEIFKEIPLVSRDYSLHIYYKRLKNLDYQAGSGMNAIIKKEEFKYTTYDMHTLEATGEEISEGNKNLVKYNRFVFF